MHTRKPMFVIVFLLLAAIVIVAFGPVEAADDGVYLNFANFGPGGWCSPSVPPGSSNFDVPFEYNTPVDITWTATITGPAGVSGTLSGSLSAGAVSPTPHDNFFLPFTTTVQLDAPWEVYVLLEGFNNGVLTTQATGTLACLNAGGADQYQVIATGFDDLATPAEVEEVVEEPVPGCDVLITIPSTAVGATITADTPVYWTPGEMSTETFPAGLTLRAIGVDESGAYTKVLYACGYYWVPSSVIGPNYDEVWNGAPLPTDVVE